MLSTLFQDQEQES